MHDEYVAARVGDRADEVADEGVLLFRVEADPMLDRDRQRDRVAHRRDALRHERRLAHQARPEAAGLHALRRTAAIEVDLVVAPPLAKPRRMRELGRIAAAKLQRNGLLGRIEVEMPRHVAVRKRRRGDHLGVEARVLRQLAMEEPAMPVRPVHHRGDAEAPAASVLF